MRESVTGFIDPCFRAATTTRAYRSEKLADPSLIFGLRSEKKN
jgi:hypothetical protein